jgi:hypothetical protein
MAVTKDLRRYLRSLTKQGYRLVPTHGSHFRIYFGDKLVATAGGGQEYRSVRNLMSEIRAFERQRPRGR